MSCKCLGVPSGQVLGGDVCQSSGKYHFLDLMARLCRVVHCSI